MFAATSDQQLFETTTERFLGTHHSVEHLRELADRPSTFEPHLWAEGAALGWTSLLVPEALGGGSISGNGVVDLAVVCSSFGRHAAPGPLFGTNLVAAALGRWGSPDHQAGPLADLLSGAVVAAWGQSSTAAVAGGRRTPVVATASPHGSTLSGRVHAVEGADAAAHLLLTASGADGPAQHLVPMSASGVELVPRRGLDLTRRYHDVVLHDVVLPGGSMVGAAGEADEHDAQLLDLLAVMSSAEMVGAVERAFSATLAWTADRYSFGRPLASYQAIKHRMAGVRTELEAGEAITGRAAEAVGAEARDARAWASAAMAHVADRAPEAVQECIQFHGGIGVTYELDLHLFLRRVVVDSQLHGSAREFRRRLGSLVVADQTVAS